MTGRRTAALYCGILLAGSLYGGGAAVVDHLRLCGEWRETPPAGREALILGPYAPVVRNVRERIPPGEGFLLASGVDPAPLPYALFPRPIWKTGPESESTDGFMELPAPRWPRRPPESFPVSWRLELRDDNLERGGDLTPVRPTGGAR